MMGASATAYARARVPAKMQRSLIHWLRPDPARPGRPMRPADEDGALEHSRGIPASVGRMKDMDHGEIGVEILARLRQRDDAVLSVLLARHGAQIAARVRGTWRGIVDADVEEIVADVMADAWFRAAEVDLSRGSLETWLAMRARYRTLDRLRAARRGRSLASRIAGAWRSGAATPDYPSNLDAYLAGLTDLDRSLIQLRFIEGRPVAEVAVACGLTPKAAEHRLARLRDRLRARCAAVLEIGVTSDA